MAGKLVLLVEGNAVRRGALARSLSSRGMKIIEAENVATGIAWLGRADFSALVAGETRHVALRGLMRLGRKRHPNMHMFVAAQPASDPAAIRKAVAAEFQVLPAGTPSVKIAAAVETALAGPAPMEFETFNTGMVKIDVEAALRETDGAAPAPVAPADDEVFGVRAADAEPVLEGALDDTKGAVLLMTVFSQELTGRLVVDSGPARGTLCFLKGEPVWIEHHDGDAGLLALLRGKQLLPARTSIPAVPEGQLLGVLVNRGIVGGDALHRMMHELIRERVGALVGQNAGAYRFVEDAGLAQAVPIIAVNPFGVVLANLRQWITPDYLAEMAEQMKGHFLVPGPALRAAAPKLSPFAGGARLEQLVDGTRTVAQLQGSTRLDSNTWTLVVMVMLDAELVSAAEEARPVMHAASSLTGLPPVTGATAGSMTYATVLYDEQNAARAGGERDEVLGLYMRIKPLTVPAQVLGVAENADRATLDRAYADLVKKLDAAHVSGGASGELLQAHVEELRRKARAAYDFLAASA